MTKEQYIKQYAENSSVTVEWLKEHNQIAVKCNCDYRNCKGWVMVDKDIYDKNNTKR